MPAWCFHFLSGVLYLKHTCNQPVYKPPSHRSFEKTRTSITRQNSIMLSWARVAANNTGKTWSTWTLVNKKSVEKEQLKQESGSPSGMVKKEIHIGGQSVERAKKSSSQDWKEECLSDDPGDWSLSWWMVRECCPGCRTSHRHGTPWRPLAKRIMN